MKILSGFEKAPLRKLSALIGQMKVQRILEITQGQKSSQQLEEIRKSIAKTPKEEFLLILIKQSGKSPWNHCGTPTFRMQNFQIYQPHLGLRWNSTANRITQDCSSKTLSTDHNQWNNPPSILSSARPWTPHQTLRLHQPKPFPQNQWVQNNSKLLKSSS